MFLIVNVVNIGVSFYGVIVVYFNLVSFYYMVEFFRWCNVSVVYYVF